MYIRSIMTRHSQNRKDHRGSQETWPTCCVSRAFSLPLLSLPLCLTLLLPLFSTFLLVPFVLSRFQPNCQTDQLVMCYPSRVWCLVTFTIHIETGFRRVYILNSTHLARAHEIDLSKEHSALEAIT